MFLVKFLLALAILYIGFGIGVFLAFGIDVFTPVLSMVASVL